MPPSPRHFLIIVCLLPVFAWTITGQVTEIEVKPSTFVLGANIHETLRVKCKVSDESISSISFMEIGKLDGSNRSKIALVTLRDDHPTIVDASLKGRSTASGVIRNGEGGLEVKVSDLQCSDGGTYYCLSAYSSNTSNVDEVNVTVQAKAHAEYLNIERWPNATEYRKQSRVYLHCSGDVGNRFDITDPSSVFLWETKLPTDNTWIHYRQLDSRCVFYSVPETGESRCQYHWTSILVHSVTDRDDGRIFRCSVIDDEVFALTTIRVQKQVESVSSPSVCVVVGLSIGLFELLIILVLTVCLYIKCRN